MSYKSLIFSLPILWNGATASPAGPGSWTHGKSNVVATDAAAAAAYTLIDNYNAANWLTKFNFENIADPTHGFVNYVNQQDAQSLGLYKVQNNQVYMGVDSKSILSATGTGRKSVRVQSKNAYNNALIIADFAHVPGTACGSWPAFWMVGPNWPNQGEIDIYEGVNLVANNQMTLHTAPGCNPGVGPGGETGTRLTGDCGANGGSTGCGVAAPNGTTFGTPFNAYGGGVYATLWTTTGIKIWYFATRDIPADITRGTPNPTAWGTPLANFGNGGCDFAANFRDLSIVFDTTFCGDWAGSPSVWGASSCSKVNPSCAAYVAAQPQNFADTYWLVNSVKVYSV
ncbi:hypothetical protein ACJQWK_10540 [Exserohilum turcicum]|uniref:endo-1,3(4)-beta-glucanase n=1 Tax=Exserohilum turcicum (strain 28A) TaxID=671987 RepID=R0I801_EXST2|nr:glycoside hydrolase family 16 protein [Exserohilum turcica Et28A]EOA81640.1 glycoside hydrolase family 16 protein [Exserohilum turcica Et28A]